MVARHSPSFVDKRWADLRGTLPALGRIAILSSSPASISWRRQLLRAYAPGTLVWLAILGLAQIPASGNEQGLIAVGACFALGVIIGRPGALVVPPVAALAAVPVIVLIAMLSCSEASCENDTPILGSILVSAALVLVGDMAVLSGLLLRVLVPSATKRRAT